MKKAETDVWSKLADTPAPKGEQIVARLVDAGRTDRVVAGLDSAGKRHILVKLEKDEEGLNDARSRGVEVQTRYLSLQGSEKNYIDLICHESGANEGLNLIGTELVELLSEKDTPPAYSVKHVLGKWRRFWANTPSHLLSKEQQIGLFAEVFFLTEWLIPKLGQRAAVNAWRGPHGSRHDFELQGTSYEAKATLSSRGPIHRVNGIDQLTPPENGRLFVFSLCLAEEAGATECLPSLLRKCKKTLSMAADALIAFEELLSRAGYSETEESEYEKLKVRVILQNLYKVTEGFPRLIRSMLHSGLPGGVETVEYSINLSGFESYRLASDSEEFRLL